MIAEVFDDAKKISSTFDLVFVFNCVCIHITSLLGTASTIARMQLVACRVQPGGEASTTNTASLSFAQTLTKWRP